MKKSFVVRFEVLVKPADSQVYNWAKPEKGHVIQASSWRTAAYRSAKILESLIPKGKRIYGINLRIVRKGVLK